MLEARGRGVLDAPPMTRGGIKLHPRGAIGVRALHQHHPREARAQGEPGGRCTRGPRAEITAQARKSTGTGGDNRPSLRSGLRLIRDLLGEPALATVARAKLLSSARAWRVHGRARTTRLRRPRMMPLVNRHIPVHRVPPHVRDDRDTPLLSRRDGCTLRKIRISVNRNIFANAA